MSISKTKRKLVWELYGGRCAYCHASVAFDEMTIDHIIPQSDFETEQEADGCDRACMSFWDEYREPVGKGGSPEESLKAVMSEPLKENRND